LNRFGRWSVVPLVRQDVRAPFVEALQPAREAAYLPGEYVGQESFMRAGEIRELARHAGIGPGVPVLDLCCGVAGPGRLVMAELGCDYLGVDSSGSAVAIARHLAGDLPGRFEQAHLPPLPDGPFEVVLLLETMLAFADKRALTGEVARVLRPGGRFGFTVEEGPPLTARERADMPDADTVWPVELDELTALLAEAGLPVAWSEECTRPHLATATALLQAFRAESAGIARGIGTRATAELIAAHELWCDWLGGGRVRKFAVVAEKR
jgi:SAM-dependent methyltransferase